MRFAITAFNNKCIDAEEFDFELNKNLFIVCPNKGCSSPLTYIRTVEGKRYFRHPRRKQKELHDPNFQCEQRAKGITPKAMRAHNKVVEQTTIQQFQKNFYKVIANLYGWDDKTLDNWRRRATDPKFIKLMDIIDKRSYKEKKDHIKNNILEMRKARQKYKNISNKSIYFELLEELEETGGYSSLNKSDFIENPQIVLFTELATRTVNSKKDHQIPIKYKGSHPLVPSDRKDFDDFINIYPLIISEQLTTLPRILEMLLHENSVKMRNFFLYTFFCQEFLEALKSHEVVYPDEPYSPKEYHGLTVTIGEYFETNEEREDRPLNLIYSEIIKQLDDFSISSFIFFPQFISSCLLDFEVEKYLKAVRIMEESNDEDVKCQSWKGGHVYLAYNESLFKRGIDEEVKIGKTKSIPDRNSSYQTYSSDGFIFERCWSVNNMALAEKYIHRKLNQYKIKEGGGKEWFHLSVDDARQKVGKLINNYEKEYGFFDEEAKATKGFK